MCRFPRPGKNCYSHYIYEEDENAEMEAGVPAEENRAIRERIQATPNRYLKFQNLTMVPTMKSSARFLTSLGRTMSTYGERHFLHIPAPSATGKRRSPTEQLFTPITPFATAG
jgi:hypothetical protein